MPYYLFWIYMLHTYHIYIYIYIYIFMSCIKIASLDVPFWAPVQFPMWNPAAPRRWWIEASNRHTPRTASCTKFVVEFGWFTDNSLSKISSLHLIPMVWNFIPIHCVATFMGVLFHQVMSSPDALNGRPVAAVVPLREPILSWWF